MNKDFRGKVEKVCNELFKERSDWTIRNDMDFLFSKCALSVEQLQAMEKATAHKVYVRGMLKNIHPEADRGFNLAILFVEDEE